MGSARWKPVVVCWCEERAGGRCCSPAVKAMAAGVVAGQERGGTGHRELWGKIDK